MKTVTLTFLGILLSAKLLFAQNENVNLLVQSPDGKTVKLVWFIKNMDNSITGFDIKRKEGLGDWVKLNAEAVLPEISTKKNLAVVESDKSEASRIKARLFQLIGEHKLMEIDHNEYLRKSMNDDKDIKEITRVMALDYDIALINGFAYVDHTVTSKTEYQYGLFIQGTNKLLAKVLWNYGEIPDLNMISEITSKATTKAKGIQIIWNADVDKMKSADVAGFNIYRQGIRLNTIPIVSSNNNDPSEFQWYDKSANAANISQYSISAQSIFGIEGIIKSYIYNPADHTSEYIAPVAQEITSLGYYFKEGIGVKWSFPSAYEKYLKGFYVEKNNLPNGYKRVSSLLPPSARNFADKSLSPVSTYIGIRVIAVYNDKTEAVGSPQVYIYFPAIAPPAPQDLKIKSMRQDKKISIKLSWDPAMNGDSITTYYKVFSKDLSANSFNAIEEKIPAKKSNYTFDIEHGSASLYSFFIVAYSKNSTESITSDTVSVQVPSIELPQPVIKNGFPNANRVVIQWQYPDIPDLKGFRIYQDKNILAGEQDLLKDKREFTTAELERGKTYEFTIVAVSDNNIESQQSLPVQVTIPKK